jgi:hypothetical protein
MEAMAAERNDDDRAFAMAGELFAILRDERCAFSLKVIGAALAHLGQGMNDDDFATYVGIARMAAVNVRAAMPSTTTEPNMGNSHIADGGERT